jgi:Ca2+-binding EF-hand superfamily protein
MKKATLVAALATFPVLALAQPAGAPAGGPPGRGDPEARRQMFEERFKKADADGDGMLTRAEAQQGMPRLAERFADFDANGDGKVSHDEIRAGMKRLRAQAGPGGPGGSGGPGARGGAGAAPGERAGPQARRGPEGGPGAGLPDREQVRARGEEMFRKADANSDGFLSEDEAARTSPQLAQNFAAMDADKDGRLSREEIRGFMQRQRHAQGPRGRRGGASGQDGTAPGATSP